MFAHGPSRFFTVSTGHCTQNIGMLLKRYREPALVLKLGAPEGQEPRAQRYSLFDKKWIVSRAKDSFMELDVKWRIRLNIIGAHCSR